MASFEIVWRSSTKKDLRNLPSQAVPRIVEVGRQLAAEPFPQGCEKLAGAERTYRVRVGDYRIIYEVDLATHLITIQRVRHRKDAYR
jgi:mRNA interferase RelE/StbE